MLPQLRAVTGFVGPNGSGKSLAMVEFGVLPAIDRGRVILSNMPIFASDADAHRDPDERLVHPQYVPLRSWRQLSQDLYGVTVVLDEISSMFDSRDASRMPTQIVSRFQQLRKGDNQLLWSGPDWDRCDKSLRKVTRGVVLSRGYLSEKVEGRDWGSNRLFRYRFFDATKFDEFSESSALSDRKGTIRADHAVWRRRDSMRGRLVYDTYGTVDLLDHLDQFGTCVDCGGTRRRPKCECDHPARED